MGGSPKLVVALGTGGTAWGAGRYLKERDADVVIEQAKTMLAAIVGNPLEALKEATIP